MTEANINHYRPDYLVPPGAVLEDYLESLKLSQVGLSERTGLAAKTVNEIIKGKAPISAETALKFERVLGRPAHFWSNLERQYQDDMERQRERERLAGEQQWLKQFPISSMVKNQFITKHHDKLQQLEALLAFFGIASPAQWDEVWGGTLSVAFRQTARAIHDERAIAAWLRQGEIQMGRGLYASYDRDRFQAALEDIRGFTQQTPDVFVPAMQGLCAQAGVALVFVPELPRAGVYGATRWLQGTPLLQMNLYRKTDGHFWFTFFHEAAHVLKHGRRDLFLEYKGQTAMQQEKEREANQFARDWLIPPARLRKLLRNGRPTLHAISHFAAEIGIAPGIVVGRLQHDGILPMHVGNKLKQSYQWNLPLTACQTTTQGSA